MDVKVYFHTSIRENEPITFKTEIENNGDTHWIKLQVQGASTTIFTESREESTKLLRDFINEALRCLTTPKEEENK